MTSVSNSSSGLEEETNDGEELVSSTSAGLLCPGEVDSDGPMDTAETSAFLGRQDRAESAQRIDSPPQPSLVQSSAAEAEWFGGGPSASSASVDLCLAEDDEGPMNIARISARIPQTARSGPKGGVPTNQFRDQFVSSFALSSRKFGQLGPTFSGRDKFEGVCSGADRTSD